LRIFSVTIPSNTNAPKSWAQIWAPQAALRTKTRTDEMPIAEGEKIPSVKVKNPDMSDVTTDELFAGKKVVLFAVPGAFTPTCSEQHLPGYVQHADDLKAKGVDEIICLSVNDAFVMKAWGADRGVGDKVRLIADGNGDLTKALGLEMDGSGIGFGLRAQRFAMIVEDGCVTRLAVEAPMKFEVSAAEAILAAL
jgi:peroxiredoxin